jgi:transposase-like protein
VSSPVALAALRHAEEVSRIVSKTCRYCGITPQSFYKWWRYVQLGDAGLRDRSRVGKRLEEHVSAGGEN